MSAGSAPPAALLNELVPAIKASPGCLYLGGRFAPESVKVAELRDLTP